MLPFSEKEKEAVDKILEILNNPEISIGRILFLLDLELEEEYEHIPRNTKNLLDLFAHDSEYLKEIYDRNKTSRINYAALVEDITKENEAIALFLKEKDA